MRCRHRTGPVAVLEAGNQSELRCRCTAAESALEEKTLVRSSRDSRYPCSCRLRQLDGDRPHGSCCPDTKTVSPDRGAAMSFMPTQAVRPVIPRTPRCATGSAASSMISQESSNVAHEAVAPVDEASHQLSGPDTDGVGLHDLRDTDGADGFADSHRRDVVSLGSSSSRESPDRARSTVWKAVPRPPRLPVAAMPPGRSPTHARVRAVERRGRTAARSHGPPRPKKASLSASANNCCRARNREGRVATPHGVARPWSRRGAGDRDRTGMASLEGWGSTIELHPRDLREVRGEPSAAAPWSSAGLLGRSGQRRERLHGRQEDLLAVHVPERGTGEQLDDQPTVRAVGERDLGPLAQVVELESTARQVAPATGRGPKR